MKLCDCAMDRPEAHCQKQPQCQHMVTELCLVQVPMVHPDPSRRARNALAAAALRGGGAIGGWGDGLV